MSKRFRRGIPDGIRAKRCTACGLFKDASPACKCSLPTKIRAWAKYVKDVPDVERDMLDEVARLERS
jgi:hypothetical protein